MNPFPFLSDRARQQQARLASLAHRQGMLRLQATLCLDRNCPRAHIRQLRARRKQLEFLQRQTQACWPFSIN